MSIVSCSLHPTLLQKTLLAQNVAKLYSEAFLKLVRVYGYVREMSAWLCQCGLLVTLTTRPPATFGTARAALADAHAHGMTAPSRALTRCPAPPASPPPHTHTQASPLLDLTNLQQVRTAAGAGRGHQHFVACLPNAMPACSPTTNPQLALHHSTTRPPQAYNAFNATLIFDNRRPDSPTRRQGIKPNCNKCVDGQFKNTINLNQKVRGSKMGVYFPGPNKYR